MIREQLNAAQLPFGLSQNKRTSNILLLPTRREVSSNVLMRNEGRCDLHLNLTFCTHDMVKESYEVFVCVGDSVGAWGVRGGVVSSTCGRSIPLDCLLLFSCFLQDAANHLEH